MGATKINKILKKYKRLHKQHLDSWESHHKPKIKHVGGSTHKAQCHAYAEKGNNLWKEMMEELEGQELFPKKSA